MEMWWRLVLCEQQNDIFVRPPPVPHGGEAAVSPGKGPLMGRRGYSSDRLPEQEKHLIGTID